MKPLFVTNLGCVYAPQVFLAVHPGYVLSQLYVYLTLSPHTACFQLGNIPIFVSDTDSLSGINWKVRRVVYKPVVGSPYPACEKPPIKIFGH